MHKEEKRYGKKALILVSALTMAMTATVGGTVAWLIADTKPVVNTFTYGDIDITLEETENKDEGDQNPDDGDPNTNTYEMVPGTNIKKDPTVTVLGDSEACWLFVELEESENFTDFMEYNMAAGWTELEDGIWYRETAYSAEDQEFAVLLNNEVTVMENITKADLNALTETTYPTLTVTAYAVQREGFATAADAWAEVK